VDIGMEAIATADQMRYNCGKEWETTKHKRMPFIYGGVVSNVLGEVDQRWQEPMKRTSAPGPQKLVEMQGLVGILSARSIVFPALVIWITVALRFTSTSCRSMCQKGLSCRRHGRELFSQTTHTSGVLCSSYGVQATFGPKSRAVDDSW
jgi:hypothetical protein